MDPIGPVQAPFRHQGRCAQRYLRLRLVQHCAGNSPLTPRAANQVKVFLEDIEDARQKPSEIYFCGLMVFTRSSTNCLKVLDGQQRLATTIMLFSAIRNWLGKYGDYAVDKIKVEDQLIWIDEIGGSGKRPRLELTPPNNDTFQRYVVTAVPVSDIEKAIESAKVHPTQERNLTLLNAALQVNQFIEEKASKFGEKKGEAHSYFLSLITYLRDAVQVVRFIVNNDNAAYTLFETLNDRGLELAPLDLVKNFLFSRAEKYRQGSLRDFEDRWAEMMTLLGSSKADAFLRAFWASRHVKVEGPKLFAAFKKAYDSPPDKVNEVSLDLKSAAERYKAFTSSSDPIWAGYSEKSRRSVDAIETIGSSQMHPLLLAGLEKFSQHEMERLLHLLEVISVRFQLIYRGRPGRIESLGAKTALQVMDGKITTASQLRGDLSELYIEDSPFKERFKKAEMDGKKARYVITVLERQSLLREGSTFPNELIPGDVTVEHIFPKSPKGEWEKQLDAEPDFGKMLNRLGNLCLLTDVNRALGNKRWEEKLEVYGRSRLRTTNQVNAEKYPDGWNRESIERRQGYMAELAVAAWRFD
jgi:hypothetical protein